MERLKHLQRLLFGDVIEASRVSTCHQRAGGRNLLNARASRIDGIFPEWDISKRHKIEAKRNIFRKSVGLSTISRIWSAGFFPIEWEERVTVAKWSLWRETTICKLMIFRPG
jgi:hypothetical protein